MEQRDLRENGHDRTERSVNVRHIPGGHHSDLAASKQITLETTLRDYESWLDEICDSGRIDLDEAAWGLVEEVGELCGKLKRMERGDFRNADEFREAASYEVGDVLFYTLRVARLLGTTGAEVLARNVAKIEDRRTRGLLRGNGDSR